MSSRRGSVKPDTPWCVQLFGAFQAERAGVAASFRTRKTAGLLAYVAFYVGKPISKELLIDTFWPEHNVSQGRQSLRMAISSLRSSLAQEGWDPDRYLLSDREVVELAAGVKTDVGDFQAAVEAAKEAEIKVNHLRQAVALYTGPLLSGFGEEWILPQALELEELFAQAVRDLVVTLGAGGASEGAEVARRAISLYPQREDLQVALMRAYANAGHNSMVLKQYEDLEKMLDETWGETPGEEAMSLLESLPRRNRPDVVAADLASATLGAPPTRTTFFGRTEEIAELVRMIGQAHGPRLVTLVGLGGSGKTRLAQRVIEESGDNAWFVSLVGIESGEQIEEALLIEVDLAGSRDEAVRIFAEHVQSLDNPVLTLDNLEHIVGPGSELIAELLEECPTLKILATSRVPLGIAGERLYPVAPLPLPQDYRDLAALRGSPSVELLVDAAQGVRPGFSVTPANAQSVLLLVQRLEGIPLAIELAAAKLGVLTPAQVIASLGRRVDLETSRPIVREQHRSLRMVVDWSLALLMEEDRRAFAKLGVCRGGFQLSLGRALLGDEAGEIVERLSRCSLMGWSESSDEVRFSMLETVREMAVQLLDEDDAQFEQATIDHFDYCHALTNAPIRQTDPSAWIDSITADTGNILAALEAGTAGEVEPIRAWELAFPIHDYLDRRGRPQIWVGPLQALYVATSADLDAHTAARAHMLLATAHYGLRSIRSSFDHYVLAMGFADQTDDTDLRIAARTDSVSSAITLSDFDHSEKALREAISMLPEQGGDAAKASCYLNLAWVTFDRCAEDDSTPVFEQAVKHARASGDQAMVASAMVGLACSVGNSRYEAAQPIFDEARNLWSECDLPARLAHFYYNRAMIDYRHGKLERALAHVETSYRQYVECGVALGQSALTIGGTAFAAAGDVNKAAICWGRAERARRRQQMEMIPFLAVDYNREYPKVVDGLSPKEFEMAWRSSLDASDVEFVEGLFGAAS